MSTIRQVAKHAGVSRGTVSNVINRPEIVAEETRRRVLGSIESLNFVPSYAARVLAGARSQSLGLVVYGIDNPFFVEIARGVEEVATQNGYVVSLLSTDAEPDRERRALNALQAQRVSGILLTPGRGREGLVNALRTAGVNVVILDRAGSPEECSVSVDDRLGGLLAGRHLLKHGYTKLAFVGMPRVAKQHSERLKGLRDAVREAQLDPKKCVQVVPVTSLTIAGGESAVKTLLEAIETIPEGILCGNDLIAVGIIRQLNAAGISVPEDIAVIGYDDIELVSLIAVPITSVRQPMYDLGKRAMELLLSEISDPHHQHEQVRFAPQLVERSTVGDIANVIESDAD